MIFTKNFTFNKFRHLFAGIAVVQEGRELLPHCDLCGMHMPSGRLLKHQRKKRCERNTQMRWRRKDVVISIQCKGATFSLTGEDDAECIEGVENFKYLGRMLDWSDNDWTEVLRNFGKSRRV